MGSPLAVAVKQSDKHVDPEEAAQDSEIWYDTNESTEQHISDSESSCQSENANVYESGSTMEAIENEEQGVASMAVMRAAKVRLQSKQIQVIRHLD